MMESFQSSSLKARAWSRVCSSHSLLLLNLSFWLSFSFISSIHLIAEPFFLTWQAMVLFLACISFFATFPAGWKYVAQTQENICFGPQAKGGGEIESGNVGVRTERKWRGLNAVCVAFHPAHFSLRGASCSSQALSHRFTKRATNKTSADKLKDFFLNILLYKCWVGKNMPLSWCWLP